MVTRGTVRDISPPNDFSPRIYIVLKVEIVFTNETLLSCVDSRTKRINRIICSVSYYLFHVAVTKSPQIFIRFGFIFIFII